jgi:F0F1-type ATP synthase assembly protein I
MNADRVREQVRKGAGFLNQTVVADIKDRNVISVLRDGHRYASYTWAVIFASIFIAGVIIGYIADDSSEGAKWGAILGVSTGFVVAVYQAYQLNQYRYMTGGRDEPFNKAWLTGAFPGFIRMYLFAFLLMLIIWTIIVYASDAQDEGKLLEWGVLFIHGIALMVAFYDSPLFFVDTVASTQGVSPVRKNQAIS